MTKKARFINKLTALSGKEKAQIISFFNKYPNYENRIDWNRKSLQYSDFEKVFKLAERSKNKQKLKAKENPRLMFENYNCEILYQNEHFIMVTPIDHKCAVFFNSFNCGGEGAKWCIGDSNYPGHWDCYGRDKNIFVLVYFKEKQPVIGRKIIVQYNVTFKYYYIWLNNDKGIKSQPKIRFLTNIILFLSKFKIKNANIYSQLLNIINNEIPVLSEKLINKISIYPKSLLRLEIGWDLADLIYTEETKQEIKQKIKNMRKQIVKEKGIKIPLIRIIDNVQLEDNEYRFYIKGRYAGSGFMPEGFTGLKPSSVLVNNLHKLIKYNFAEIALFSKLMK